MYKPTNSASSTNILTMKQVYAHKKYIQVRFIRYLYKIKCLNRASKPKRLGTEQQQLENHFAKNDNCDHHSFKSPLQNLSK